MNSSPEGSSRLSFLATASPAVDAARLATGEGRLSAAIARTTEFLLQQQHPEGYWVAELEGDTILESEYILLLAFLGQGQSTIAREAAAYLLQQQAAHGGWAIYPGGPIEISASVKAYLALKITGTDPQCEAMVRARQAIVAAGGVERVNSFTRYYLAMLGLIPYALCPAVPPELILLPHGAPFNIYEMSAWSRTIVVPLSLLWAFQPVAKPQTSSLGELTIDELYASPTKQMPRHLGGVNQEGQRGWIDWTQVFRRIDAAIKWCEACGIKPLRKRAISQCVQWILDRLEDSDGLGAIFPPIVWTIIGLRSCGYSDESPEIQQQLAELERLIIRERGTVRLQPCKSPVWDTAITLIALRDAGVPRQHAAVQRAVNWLLAKEVRRQGDWSLAHPQTEPGGWYFEFQNVFYPDVDDTAMVLIALSRCLPELCRADGSPSGCGPAVAATFNHAILDGVASTSTAAVAEVEESRRLLGAIGRGINWLRAMQSRDGGWGAFDSDNTREVFTKVPFADHNAMIDPSTSDITARVLEAAASVGVRYRGGGLHRHQPQAGWFRRATSATTRSTSEDWIERALEFIWRDQQADAAWFGRWGVNYIYGTWQVLQGLTKLGVSPDDRRLQEAADWLVSRQQSSGGWGESPGSYDDPTLRGRGPVTASQTAWALLGLLAAGRADSEPVERGIRFLLDTQQPDGTWHESEFTGTGFPRVFYLRYHYYCIYFPLMALARYRAAITPPSSTWAH